MMWFPQIGRGSSTQYPLRRTRRWRNIENRLESGERIQLPDPGSKTIEWQMAWRDLNDAEAATLRDLFAAVKGSYGSFGFVDPLANLLGWSEDLSRPEWDRELLTVNRGPVDPFGSERAWTLSNPAAGEQSLQQAVNIPASYVSCFSVWLRADVPAAVYLERDGTRVKCLAADKWERFYLTATGAGGSSFALALPAGAEVQAYGFQTEAQPFPSQYKRSRAARGIYERSCFANDELTFTSTAPGLIACDIALISRV